MCVVHGIELEPVSVIVNELMAEWNENAGHRDRPNRADLSWVARQMVRAGAASCCVQRNNMRASTSINMYKSFKR